MLLNFTVDQLMNKWINILSLFNDKLVISKDKFHNLFIYSRDGDHLSTIEIKDKDELRDVTWTPMGKIIYTTYNNKVVVMSSSGKIITTHTKIKAPRYLSVSNDDIIYLADYETGVYQSIDDGVSWNFVFNSTEGWHCLQVIKVTANLKNNFWILVEDNENNRHICEQNASYAHPDIKVTWTFKKAETISRQERQQINLRYSTLSYDGTMNIFLNDVIGQKIHALFVNSRLFVNHSQSSFSYNMEQSPCSLAVDKQRHLLYVGLENGIVQILEIAYRDVEN